MVPLFNMAVIQNSPLNMLGCVKSRRYILKNKLKIAASQKPKLWEAFKGTVKQENHPRTSCSSQGQ
jgi:hypothetical protein